MSHAAGRKFTALLASVGVMAALAVSATAADASITLTGPGPYPSTGSTAVTVSGTLPGFASTATHVTAVNCNATVTLGSRCDLASATPSLRPVADFTGSGTPIVINVRRDDTTPPAGWRDYSFLTGAPVASNPATYTTCLNDTAPISGSQCAVVVSYYRVSGGTTTQLGAESRNVLFTP